MTLFKPFTVLLALFCALHLPMATAARSIVINVYTHDDLAKISDAQLNHDYFQHWIDEMRQITEHPVEVVFRRNIPGITDIAYSDKSAAQTLEEFTDIVGRRSEAKPHSLLKKFLLLTNDPYEKFGFSHLAGLAYVRQYSAIASISHYQVPAHELGHTFSADHESAEVLFNPWVCETYTFAPRIPIRSNCYRYSDKNRQNIADYIRINAN